MKKYISINNLKILNILLLLSYISACSDSNRGTPHDSSNQAKAIVWDETNWNNHEWE